jgi:Na+/H+-dicarboxylate symporter
MSPTFQVVAGLALGLAVGVLIGGDPSAPGAPFARAVTPIGTLWINAIRMTLIPLIVSLLVVGIAEQRDARRIGKLGVMAFAMFIIALAAVGALTAIVSPPIYSLLTLDPVGVEALRATLIAPPGTAELPTIRDWILSLVPSNPVSAAAEGAMLPLLVFTIAFAFALTRLAERERGTVVGVFQAVSSTMLVIVRWVLMLAPIGVFALAVTLGTRLGVGAAGAIGFYVALVIGLHLLVTIALYAIAVVGGRMSLRRFAQAAAPAQAVAFSSRSSLASLPALIDSATRLQLPREITGFVLPLAVSVFKLTSPIYWTAGAILIARLYGVEFGPAQVFTMAGAAVLLNAATPGIPSGGLLIQAPVYTMLGLPLEGIGLLIAVDTIPDMFKTAFNVTADLTVAVVLGRYVSSG